METLTFNNGYIVKADRTLNRGHVKVEVDRSDEVAVPTYHLSIGSRQVISIPAPIFDGFEDAHFSLFLFDEFALADDFAAAADSTVFFHEGLPEERGEVVIFNIKNGEDSFTLHDSLSRPFVIHNIGALGCIVKDVKCIKVFCYVIENDRIVSESQGLLDCSGKTPLVIAPAIGSASYCISWKDEALQNGSMTGMIPIVLVLKDHKAKLSNFNWPEQIFPLGEYDFERQCYIEFEDVLIFAVNDAALRDDLCLSLPLCARRQPLSLSMKRGGKVKMFHEGS